MTIKTLEAKIDLLNSVSNTPMEPWKTLNGKLVGQIGNYHIYSAYGKWSVHQIMNKGGGARDVIQFGTKREVASKIGNLINFTCNEIEKSEG
jgi:hypothetical protein